MVTKENYEEYLMLYADGELDMAAMASFEAFLNAHPELKEQLAAWQAIKLEADQSIVFEAKDGLLKPESKRIALLKRPIIWAAAAAVIIAVLMIPVLWRNQPQKQLVLKPVMGKNKSAEAVAAQSRNANLSSEKPSPHHQPNRAASAVRYASVKAVFRDTIAAPHTLTPSSFDVLPVASVASQIQPVALAVANEIPQQLPAPERSSRLPLIRLADANQPAVATLKQELDARLSQISHAAKAIHETAIAVRIGSKNHYLNF